MKYCILFFSLCLMLTTSYSQIPGKLSYQGLLTNSSGSPLSDGNYDLTFAIYNSSSGGTLRHTETHSSVPVEKGTFSVTLGSITPFAFAFTESLYIEVTVDDGPADITYPVTFTTRTELTSAPYALGPWTSTDNILYFTGTVGIGTPIGNSKLNVGGSLSVGGLYSALGTAPLDGAIIQGMVGIGAMSPSYKLHVAGDTPADMYSIVGQSTQVFGISDNTNVGIAGIGSGKNNGLGASGYAVGMMGIGNKTDAKGAIGVYAALHNGLVDITSTPPTTALYADGKSNGYAGIFSNGYVGIGTLTPSTTLDVEGATKTTTIQITEGASEGYVLQSDSSGSASWVNPGIFSGGGDNLGNHTATQNINLNGHFLSHDGNNDGISLDSDGMQVTSSTANPRIYLNGVSSDNTKITMVSSSQSWGVNAGNEAFYLRDNTSDSMPFIVNAGSRDSILFINGTLVKIGNASSTTLEVSGTVKTDSFQLVNGAANGYLLGSDSEGKANWIDPSTILVTDTIAVIADADGNTKIEAGQSNDDKIHFTTGGTEYFTMKNGSLEVNNTGGSVYIGASAGASETYSSSRYNIGIGSNAFQNSSSSLSINNIAIGRRGLQNTSTGHNNIAVGTDALQNNTTANNNISIGISSLNSNSTGSYNIALGTSAGNLATGNRNVFIGYQAGFSETGNDKLYIENGSVATPLIYGDFAKKHLTINDSLTTKYFKMKNGAASGYVLQSDADGYASWVSPSNLATSVWTSSGANIYNNNTGNVGIGTSSPGSNLHVYDSTGNTDSKVESVTGHAYTSLAAPSGYENAFVFQTVSSGYKTRWEFGKSVATESGSNSGSDFFINRYSDAGSYLSQPFTITRSTGNIGVNISGAKSSFDVNGTVGMKVKTGQVVGTNDPDGTGVYWFYSSSTGTNTITLPAASSCANRLYVIINQSGGARSISSYKDLSATSQTTISDTTSLWIVSDGTNWLQVK